MCKQKSIKMDIRYGFGVKYLSCYIRDREGQFILFMINILTIKSEQKKSIKILQFSVNYINHQKCPKFFITLKFN